MKNNGRRLSYLLRHNNEDLKMDMQGFVLVKDIINKLDISKEELDEIVKLDDKGRFGYDPFGTKIRARQGHNKKLNLKIKFKKVSLPVTYYHGTSKINAKIIINNGLEAKNRDYVHLSKDFDTAMNVGLRHSKDVSILAIDGNQMARDGYKIYESENGVILTKFVPCRYINLLKIK